MKIYLSGPIADQPNDNLEAFDEAEAYLTAQGYEVGNPHKICAHIAAGSCWQMYMQACLAELVCGNYSIICMLDGWKESKGATLEYRVAEAIGMTVWSCIEL